MNVVCDTFVLTYLSISIMMDIFLALLQLASFYPQYVNWLPNPAALFSPIPFSPIPNLHFFLHALCFFDWSWWKMS